MAQMRQASLPDRCSDQSPGGASWAPTGCTRQGLRTILTSCAALAKLDYVPELSSHSLRRGMATSAHRAGVDFRDIKPQGGWRHDGTRIH